MAPPILVTGGTGTLGRLVVAGLRGAGHEVRVLSRHGRAAGEGIESVAADLTTGAGVDGAVQGVEIIVHCAGSRTGDEDKAMNLVRAASRAGVRHLVYISVVGADRIPVDGRLDRAMFGYFASKLAAERVVAECGLPWTTLRATQLQDSFLKMARQMTKLPVLPVPSGFRFQPIDAGEVAARLAELALEPPAGLVPDMAGPRAYSLAELLRTYLQVTHRSRPMVPMRVPGKAARAFRAGANLAPERAVGRHTWEEFLAVRVTDKADELKVVYVTYIEATPDKVWQAVTDPDLSGAYWGHRNVSDWRTGSIWEHHRMDGSGVADVVGTVVESEPPSRLVLTWADPEDRAPAAGADTAPGDRRLGRIPSRVAFDIEAGQGIVRLTLTHDHIPTKAERDALATGWAAVLSNLKTYLETGHPLPQPPWEMPPGFVRK